MFINLSNHPSEKWGKKQKDAAIAFGEIIDLPFPNISPYLLSVEVENIAEEYLQKVKAIIPKINGSALLVSGEQVCCFYLVQKLLEAGYLVVVATTERTVTSVGDKKESVFNFIQFRKI